MEKFQLLINNKGDKNEFIIWKRKY
jgi:hypothetical protein